MGCEAKSLYHGCHIRLTCNLWKRICQDARLWRGCAGMCVRVFCVCISVTDRDLKSSKRTMRLVQDWTLGDGDRQRDGVIGGRRWQGTKGQWVKLFVSPPAPSPSEKLQIKQMTLRVKHLVKMQSVNTLSGAINFEVFCIWFVCVHIALFWMK